MERQWAWVADMTADGMVTSSDVWAWVGWLFYYPGDIAIYGMLKVEGFAKFFELTPAYYGGFLSLFISLGTWGLLWMSVMDELLRRKRSGGQSE